jgi:hypothetical protein
MVSKAEFGSFIERLISGSSCLSDWSKYAVAHYHDAAIEGARVRLVRCLLYSDLISDLRSDQITELRSIKRSLESPGAFLPH